MSGYTEHHIKAAMGDIAPICLIPGHEGRGIRIAKRLTDCRVVARSRGYLVHTGTYRDIPVTVCSTGMGGPQAAIAVEELGRLGGRVFIRLGSAGGIDPRTKVGDIVIATSAYRGGGTADEYLPKEFPAVADFHVTQALVDSAKRLGAATYLGCCATVDAFYGPGGDEQTALLKRGRVLCVEMEADAVFIIASYRGYRAGAAFVLDNGPATESIEARSGSSQIADHEKDGTFLSSEGLLIDIGLGAVEILGKGIVGESQGTQL